MSDHPQALQKLLTLPELQTATGLSRSAIYDIASRAHFPSAIKIGPLASAWVAI